jgi:hypothetical protein
MGLTVLLHVIFAGVWLGCILVEAVFEHGSGPQMRLYISKLHWSVDKAIEIPAFLGVGVTGGLLFLGQAQMTPLLWTKAAFGAAAILLNVICVWIVRVRLAHALSGNDAAWLRWDYWQHKLGGVVLAGLVIALGIGAYVAAGR